MAVQAWAADNALRPFAATLIANIRFDPLRWLAASGPADSRQMMAQSLLHRH
jgi:hypothetical protein